MLEFVPVAVPGADLDAVGARLSAHHLVGAVIDGAELGVDGYVLARIVGDSDGGLVSDHDHDPSTDVDELMAELGSAWPGTLVGAPSADGWSLTWPVVLEPPRLHTVAVTPPTDLMLSVVAGSTGLTLHEARVDDRVLVGIAEVTDLHPSVLVDVLVNAKGRSVVMWRAGAHAGVHVMKRGKHAHAHLWEPAWTPFGHPDLDDLRDPGVAGDAAAIGTLLDLSDTDIVSLRAMMRRPRPDLDALAQLLHLPAEAVDVLEGRTRVVDLPGGGVPEPLTWKQEVVRLAQGSEHDPAWMRWYDAGARDLRPWYVVSSLVSLAVGVVLLTGRLVGDSTFWVVVGLVLVLGTAIDLPWRWWRRRRRRRAAG